MSRLLVPAGLAALLGAISGDPASAGDIDPTTGSVGVQYDCENNFDGASDSGSTATATILYDFPAGAGNFADASASWSRAITQTTRLGGRTRIVAPTATTAGDCTLNASTNGLQAYEILGAAASTVPVQADIAISWTVEVPDGTAAFDFILSNDVETLLSESFAAEPLGVTPLENPGLWTISPLGGGRFSVGGTTSISFTQIVANPLEIEVNANTQIFLSGGGTNISATSDFRDGLTFELTSLASGVTVLPLGAQLPPDPQTPDQQDCIVNMNKGAAAIAKAQGKLTQKCFDDATKGKVPSGHDCAVADPKGKVGKVADKAAKTESKRCSEPEQVPDFGFAGLQTQVGAARGEMFALYADLLGTPIDGAIATDKGGIKCQRTLLQDGAAFLLAVLAEMNQRKEDALEAGAGTVDDLSAAIEGGGASDYLQVRGVQKKHIKLFSRWERSCRGISDGSALFPGLGAGVSIGAVPGLAADRAFCRAIALMNVADGLVIDTDPFATCP
jgi:hypothetical protein